MPILDPIFQATGPRALVDDVTAFLRSLHPAIPAAIIILVLTYVAARSTSVRLRGALTRTGFAINVSILLARALWVGVWVTGFLLMLKVVGIGLTPLAAFIGVVGLAASLSLQAVLQNLVAGVYLLAERPFNIGDFIAVVGANGLSHEGEVTDIQMRTTHLRSLDDELILIPNSGIFSGVVTNRTAVGGFVQQLILTLPRSNDPQTIRGEVVDMLKEVPSVLVSPSPRLRIIKIEAESWTAALSFWASTPDSSSTAAWVISREFPEATVDLQAAPV